MLTITFKVDKDLEKAMQNVMKPLYSTKTEFIREAIRKHVKDLEVEKAMVEIRKFRGAIKGNISNEDVERIKDRALKELAKERGWKL